MLSARKVSENVSVMINPKASSKSLYLSCYQRLIAWATDSKLGLDLFFRHPWKMECYTAITSSTAALKWWDLFCKLFDPPKGEVSAVYVTVFKLNLNDFSFYLLLAYLFLFSSVVEPDVSSIKPLLVSLPIPKFYLRESKYMKTRLFVFICVI